MASADHIFCHRVGYTHHGIDFGDGTVIHYTGEPGQKTNAVIRRTPIDRFTNGCVLLIRRYASCDPPDMVIERARSRLGENKYHLTFNNCEHFAVWCKTGQARSEQVKDVTTSAGGVVGAGSAIAAGLGTVSATGAAVGLSGPGIMSGLATVGGVVGGGVVTGIAAVGAAPALITTGTMFYALKDDPILHQTEREARRVGRIATVVGAVGTSAASIGVVAATGTVGGLSAAGITSGLAAVGAAIGGGMAAGVVVAAAAPTAAAAAFGYASYRLWRRCRSGHDKPSCGNNTFD